MSRLTTCGLAERSVMEDELGASRSKAAEAEQLVQALKEQVSSLQSAKGDEVSSLSSQLGAARDELESTRAKLREIVEKAKKLHQAVKHLEEEKKGHVSAMESQEAGDDRLVVLMINMVLKLTVV
jgi:septal ring factor EnvC (AmiA/AmiB activator)